MRSRSFLDLGGTELAWVAPFSLIVEVIEWHRYVKAIGICVFLLSLTSMAKDMYSSADRAIYMTRIALASSSSLPMAMPKLPLLVLLVMNGFA